jgi:hypothetical protein
VSERADRTERTEIHGQWWLPEHEDHKVHGTFTWDQEDGGTLHLTDELRRIIWKDNVLADGAIQKYRDHPTRPPEYPVIFGTAKDRAYSLIGTFRLSANDFGNGDPFERIHVNRYLDGAFFDDPEELAVDRVIFDMRHLTGWVNTSGLEVTRDRQPAEEVFVTLVAKTMPAFQTTVGSFGVRIGQNLQTFGDQINDLGVRQVWVLRLATDQPRPLADFTDVASDFQDLLSIAVGKTADFERVQVQHPDLPLRSLDGNPIQDLRDSIDVRTRWSVRSDPVDPVGTHDMYFTLDQFGGIEGVARWLTVAETYRTELGRAMATRYSTRMHLEDRIMNVSAALDSLDRVRRATGKTKVAYLTRLRECVRFAGDPFPALIGQHSTDDWTKIAKTARNDLAHHSEMFRTSGSVGEYLLAEQLFWLFALCLLRLAQAPDEVFETIDKHGQFRWLAERANQQ